MITEKEYFHLVEKSENYVIDNPNTRLGQALFNIFFESYSEIVQSIENTDKDPYHNNQNIQRFLNYIKEHVNYH